MIMNKNAWNNGVPASRYRDRAGIFLFFWGKTK